MVSEVTSQAGYFPNQKSCDIYSTMNRTGVPKTPTTHSWLRSARTNILHDSWYFIFYTLSVPKVFVSTVCSMAVELEHQ